MIDPPVVSADGTPTISRSDIPRVTDYRDLLDALPIGVAIAEGPQQPVLFANRAFCHMLGYDREHVITLAPVDFHPPDLLARALREFAKILHGSPSLLKDFPVRRGDGSEFYADIYSTPIEFAGRSCSLASFVDVTARLQAEAALRDSEQRFRIVSTITSDMVYSCRRGQDGLFRIDWIGGQATKIFGYDNAEIFRRGCWRSLVIDEDQPIFTRAITQLKPDQESHVTLRVRNHRGALRTVRSFARAEGSEGSEVLVLYGALQDVTREMEARATLDQFFEQPLNLHLIARTSGEIVRANRAWEAVLGYKPEELVGRRYFDFVHPDDLNKTQRETGRLILGHTTYRFESRYLHKQGGYRLLAWSATADTKQQILFGSAIDITTTRDNEIALQQAYQRLEQAQRVAHLGYWELDLQTGRLYWSDEVLRIFELDAQSFTGDYAAFLARVHPEDREAVDRVYCESLALQQPYAMVHRLLFDDGRVKYVHEHCQTVYDDTGRPLYSLGIIQDVTETKLAEEQLRLAASVFEHAGEGIMVTSPQGEILKVNQAFIRTFGYTREEIIGKTPRVLHSGRHDSAFHEALWRALREHGYWHGEIWNRRKNGEIVPQMLTIAAVRDQQQAIRHYIALFSDITHLVAQQQHLQHLAHHDPLTELPNRALLADRLRQAMAQCQRHGRHLAVVYIDLDGFKVINDTYGHDTGDRLLTTIANRMKRLLREGDTLARLGGDEFVALLLDLPEASASQPFLQRLLAAAAEETYDHGKVLRVSVSMGVVYYPQNEPLDADQLLRQADQAMYRAKQAGKNRYHVFDTTQDRAMRSRHVQIDRLREALYAGELRLYYQPKVNLRTGAVLGAEALLRWQHPERGVLAPGAFLPAVENHPFLIELGTWVVDSVLSQIAAWKSSGLTLPVSVNISPLELQQADFAARVRAQLSSYPAVAAEELELEILETSALQDWVQVSRTLAECRQIGVKLSLDDFGSGYASLTYLKRLPAHIIKIDQSFVRDMLDDPDDLSILLGIVDLSEAFHRQVIAEGVETTAHSRLLLALGCECAQGYAIARPMPADELPHWVSKWRPMDAWRRQVRLTRADLPLLFAAVEHRRWVATLEAYLGDQPGTPPGIFECRFGQWLRTEAGERYGAHPALQAVFALHRDIHAQADKLIAHYHAGDIAQARTELDSVRQLRDALLVELEALAEADAEKT